MDTELLTRTKQAEIEREVAYLRLIAAARRDPNHRRAANLAPRRTVPTFAWRLLRVLRPAS
ncbi:MAG TPA: hypothetical protein VFT91_03030 [Dehalococcoidia bacterium]|nr:hypothetical protein [Dehalococcoidia bacterium]